MIMSMVGTVIYYPEESGRDPEPIAPTLTSISHLLCGQAAGFGQQRRSTSCNATTTRSCDVVSLNTAYNHVPVHRARGDDDALHCRPHRHAHAHPQQQRRGGFVNQTSEPVYKMLSVGTSILARAWPTA